MIWCQDVFPMCLRHLHLVGESDLCEATAAASLLGRTNVLHFHHHPHLLPPRSGRLGREQGRVGVLSIGLAVFPVVAHFVGGFAWSAPPDVEDGTRGLNPRFQVPPSINRLYTLVHDDQESYGLTVSAAVVLPLMGFWNSVIYLIVSHDIIRELFIRHFRRPSSRIGPNAGNGLGTGMTLTFMDPGKGSNPGHGRNKESRSDSTKRLAEEAAQIGRVV